MRRLTLVAGIAALLCGVMVCHPSRAGAACAAPSYATPPYLPAVGTTRGIVLFVDFSDSPGTDSPKTLFDALFAPGRDWAASVSYGRANWDDTYAPQWFRMPHPASDYMTVPEGGPRESFLLSDAVSAADATVNFAPFDVVYVVVPADSPVISINRAFSPTGPLGVTATADGKTIAHIVVMKPDGNVFVHETEHLFGLPDLYDVNTFGTQWVGFWDIMSSAFLRTGLLAWQRARLGYLDASQMVCGSDAVGQRDVVLSPLETPGGTKGVIFQTGASTYTVAENRQPIGDDTVYCTFGVLAYDVDTNVGSGSGPIRVRDAAPDAPVLPKPCGYHNNAPFQAGGTISVASTPSATMQVLCFSGASAVIRLIYGIVPTPITNMRCLQPTSAAQHRPVPAAAQAAAAFPQIPRHATGPAPRPPIPQP